MTAQVRDKLRHEGSTDQFPSLEAGICQRDYAVVDLARPEVVVRMSELQWELSKCRITLDGNGMLSLAPSPFRLGCGAIDIGKSVYPLYGRKRARQCDNDPEKARAIEQAAKRKWGCMMGMTDVQKNVPFTDSIPYRIPVYYPTIFVRTRMPMPAKLGGTWGETKGKNRIWKPTNKKGNRTRKARPAWVKEVFEVWKEQRKSLRDSTEWTTKSLPSTDATLLMLPLSQRIGWRKKRADERGWGKHVKCINTL
jgi:hypothetical protein